MEDENSVKGNKEKQENLGERSQEAKESGNGREPRVESSVSKRSSKRRLKPWGSLETLVRAGCVHGWGQKPDCCVLRAPLNSPKPQ